MDICRAFSDITSLQKFFHCIFYVPWMLAYFIFVGSYWYEPIWQAEPVWRV